MGANGEKLEARSHSTDSPLDSHLLGPDRVFGTSGRGVTGAITEFRYGLRANIGLEIEYDAQQSWVFATRTEDFDLEIHALLSLVDKSEALHLSGDLEQAESHSDGATLYDLESRTITAAQVSEDVIVQVTETYIVFSSSRLRCVLPCTRTTWHINVGILFSSFFLFFFSSSLSRQC